MPWSQRARVMFILVAVSSLPGAIARAEPHVELPIRAEFEPPLARNGEFVTLWIAVQTSDPKRVGMLFEDLVDVSTEGLKLEATGMPTFMSMSSGQLLRLEFQVTDELHARIQGKLKLQVLRRGDSWEQQVEFSAALRKPWDTDVPPSDWHDKTQFPPIHTNAALYEALAKLAGLLLLVSVCWLPRWAAETVMIDGRPQVRRLNVATVIGGLLVVASATSLLQLALTFQDWLGAWPNAVTAVVCTVFGGLFGGYFVAAIAPHDRMRHALQVASIGLVQAAVPIWLAMEQMTSQSLLNDLPQPILQWMVLHFIQFHSLQGALILGPVMTVWGGALFLGLLDRVRRHGRRAWTYKTLAGEEIQVFDAWMYPGQSRIWNACAALLILTCWLPILDNNASMLASWVPLFFAFRKLAQRCRGSSAEPLLASGIAPVVYLRSFGDDGLRRMHWLFELLYGLQALVQSTNEQLASKLFRQLGPAVAIGRPTEEMPEIGAARLYVSDEHWQTVVQDLLGRAGGVILQAGETAGLRWEYARVAQWNQPERTVLFIPVAQNREGLYAMLKEHLGPAMNTEFPNELGRTKFLSFVGTVSPTVVRLSPFTRLPLEHPLRPAIRRWQRIFLLRMTVALACGLPALGLLLLAVAFWFGLVR